MKNTNNDNDIKPTNLHVKSETPPTPAPTSNTGNSCLGNNNNNNNCVDPTHLAV